MAAGKKHPPEVREKAAEVYAKTASYSEAARQAGVSEVTVRRWLEGEAKPGAINARAIAKGLRTGRRALQHGLSTAALRLDATTAARDYHAIMSAVARAVDALETLDGRRGRRMSERLSRERMRAETALTDARRLALLEWDDVLSRATPEQRARLLTLASEIRSQPVGGTDPAPVAQPEPPPAQ